MEKLKKYALNKITVATMGLILMILFTLIPTNNLDLEYEINDKELESENIVYLLDRDNYVSKVITYFDKNNIEDEIKKKIEVLINGSEYLNDFYTLIPKETKLNNIKIDKDSVYLDFSNDILNVNEYFEEEMIESIVYTLTEINGINNIYITVDNKELNSLPSGKKINYPLNRSIGINKEYNINNINNISKTTVYFNKSIDNIDYLVPVTKINNLSNEKVEIIIEELKSSINVQNNLNSYLTSSVSLINYEILDEEIVLVFNGLDKNDIFEEVIYSISDSIFDNYSVNKVVFNDENGENITTISKN